MRLTLSEDEAQQLKPGDPLEYYANREWVRVTVVKLQGDLVRVTTGTMEIDAVLGELRHA